jgi:hypothetical protein
MNRAHIRAFVIGQRPNGIHTVLTGHEGTDAAEQVMRMIWYGTEWRRFYIMVNGDDPGGTIIAPENTAE